VRACTSEIESHCNRALLLLRRPDALLFDCDGVLVDTEPDGHRVAFNEAFKQKGIAVLQVLHGKRVFLLF